MNEGVSIHSLPRAEAIARQIRDYWSAKGHKVKVWVVANMQEDDRTRPLYGVRTDLLNGMPRK
jgi:hypothetical protein